MASIRQVPSYPGNDFAFEPLLREYEKIEVEASRESQDQIRYLLRLVELHPN